MHGPEETAFTDLIFSKVEELLNLEKYTLKLDYGRGKKNPGKFKECVKH